MNKAASDKALSLVGDGYIYGGTGVICSPSYRERQANQYPEYASNILNTGKKWDGKRVWDCAQLTKEVAKAGGVQLVSGATSQWKKTDWADSGTIDTIPQDETVFVYRWNGTSMQHTGVSIGDGTVVHAKGTAYGVIRQKLSEYPWTHWGLPHWDTSEKEVGTMTAVVVADSGGTVNIRSGAGKGYPRTGTVKVGQTVSVVEKQGDWCKLTNGYIMTQYLKFDDDGDTETIEEVTVKLPKEVYEGLLKALTNG